MRFYTKDMFIQLRMDGLVVTLIRTPKLEDLDTCNCIHMYDKDNWDPSKATLNIFSFSVKLITPIPKLIQSIINTVKISHLTNEQHHKYMPESLAQKWTIRLKTAAYTIKATMR